MLNAAYCITHLGLIPHPEGGYYKETYRSEGTIDSKFLSGLSGSRSYSTGIYFLLEHGNFSAFHRIKSDEMWHFYAGDPLEVIEISPQGRLTVTVLGNDLENGEVFQYVVPAGHWFGSRVKAGGNFSLVGCTVSPGFDFADFEMAKKMELKEMFPYHSSIIDELTRI